MGSPIGCLQSYNNNYVSKKLHFISFLPAETDTSQPRYRAGSGSRNSAALTRPRIAGEVTQYAPRNCMNVHANAQSPLRRRPRPARRRSPDDLQRRLAQYPGLGRHHGRSQGVGGACDGTAYSRACDRGPGQKSMIGGADIKEMARLDQASAEKFITGLRDLWEAGGGFPGPVIWGVPGWCP